jgi:squalene synthase HpnC
LTPPLIVRDNLSVSAEAPSIPQQLRERRYAARRVTRSIAGHYENFTVVSLALPRHLRQDFFNIYAFCRHTDDLADEVGDPQESLRLLDEFRRDLDRIYNGRGIAPQHPILIALSETIRRYDIPADPFVALIDAFQQDQRVARYPTYADLLGYCTRSANPVGHLVLYLAGYRDAHRQQLSDCTCTALQLTNFWQDVVPDLVARCRIYIPQEDMTRFGVTEDDLHSRRFTPAFRDLMRFEVDRADELFTQGEALLPLVNRRLRTDIALYGLGGRSILQRVRDADYNVLAGRPVLGRWAKLGLFLRTLLKL